MSASRQHIIHIASPATKHPLGINAQRVVAKRYSLKDLQGNPLETWDDIVKRVVSHVAKAETDPHRREEFLFNMLRLMHERAFIPNTPCLVNAGKPKGQLAACFVLPVPDSLEGIMEHAKYCALIHQSGGGTGMTYERLRPAGTPVGEGRGLASGPVSFMQIVNTMTETVKQGGVRRGANMGILAVSHPDILRFIHAKNDQKSLTNFNISVTVSDKFLRAVENNEWFQTEFDGKPWEAPVFDPKAGNQEGGGEGGEYSFQGQRPPKPGMVYAPDIWERIISSTHRWAEPGIIFIDNVNRHNPLKNSMGSKRASNPCAEQLLHDYNACNLGSIDVAKYFDVARNDLDWERLQHDIYWCVRFLDNVVNVCDWPLAQIHDVVHRTRPIGLGIMGFADLLLHKGIKYGSEEAAHFAEQLMQFIRRESWQASLAIGAEKGVMPELELNRAAYEKLLYEEIGVERSVPLTPRNYEVTTIAPTGTISLVAETSSGCEPNFSYAYVRKDTLGKRVYAHPLAAQVLGITFDPLNEASVEAAAEQIERRRAELPDYFVDAHSLTPDEHLHMLRAFQHHVDNSISKTVNAPASYTLDQPGPVIVPAGQRLRLNLTFAPLERGSAPGTLVVADADNMGCPVPRITGKGKGAALMRDIPATARILRAMRAAIRIPLTIKIRGGWDDTHLNAVEVARMAEAEGVDAITVHPRTRSQMFTGKAPWTIIAEVVDAVRMPVTGNGDVRSMAQARRMAEETGCGSVMIGRGALGSPWIFDEGFDRLPRPEQRAYKARVIARHVALIREQYGEKYALIQMKKHLAWYAADKPGMAVLRRQIFETREIDEALALFWSVW